MSYDTEEQQVEALKEWWKENGTPLVIGAVLGLAGFAGWKFWHQKQIAYEAAASDAYIQVSEALSADDKDGVEKSGARLKTDFADSSYAILSAFQLAKLAVDAENYDKAATELKWIIENHPSNELTYVAKIRLARILIQQDKAEQALALVTLDKDSGYYALASLVRGDALMALDRKEQALEAYEAAMGDAGIVASNPSLQIKVSQLTKQTVQPVDTEEGVSE